MAKLGNITIADKSSIYDSGGAFILSQESKDNHSETVGKNVEVKICAKNPYVVTHFTGTKNFSETFTRSFEFSQKGLDLISAKGINDLSIINATNECLIWWSEKSQLVLRIVFTNLLSVSTRAEIRVLDKNGKEKQQLPKLFRFS